MIIKKIKVWEECMDENKKAVSIQDERKIINKINEIIDYINLTKKGGVDEI